MPFGVAEKLELPYKHLHDLSGGDAVPTHLFLIVFVKRKTVYRDAHVALPALLAYTMYTQYTAAEEVCPYGEWESGPTEC